MSSPRRPSEDYYRSSRSSRDSRDDSRDRRDDYYDRDRRRERERDYYDGRRRSRSPGRRDYGSSQGYERDSYRPRSRSPVRYSRSRSPVRNDVYAPRDRSPVRTDSYSARARSPVNAPRDPMIRTDNYSSRPPRSPPRSMPPRYPPYPASEPGYSAPGAYSRPGPAYPPSSYGRNDSFATAFSHLPRENWDSIQLTPFEKNFYREHAEVSSRSDEDVSEFRQKHQMTIFGQGIPKPVHSFLEASFPEYIVKVLQKQGFTNPTAIQAQVSDNGLNAFT